MKKKINRKRTVPQHDNGEEAQTQMRKEIRAVSSTTTQTGSMHFFNVLGEVERSLES